MERILIVDDEADIRQLIRHHIERAGMQALEAASGREAIELLKNQNFALMILDLMMDDSNGFEVLEYLQENRLEILVIVLSARGHEQDKIITLGLGADDYVTKPFSPIELIARVQANLRRFLPLNKRDAETLELNGIVLDLNNYRLHCYDKLHALTIVEFELIHFFMRNPDRILTKRELYRQIWKHDNFDDNNLRVYINRLRKMLINPLTSINHLQTIRGIGYRFSGDGL